MTKMSQKYQMTKKKPPKQPKYPQNYQNDKKKYSWNHQNDLNTPKMTKITSIP